MWLNTILLNWFYRAPTKLDQILDWMWANLLLGLILIYLSLTLYPAHSRVNIINLVLGHSLLHFCLYSWYKVLSVNLNFFWENIFFSMFPNEKYAYSHLYNSGKLSLTRRKSILEVADNDTCCEQMCFVLKRETRGVNCG